jgi:hypothetical protein
MKKILASVLFVIATFTISCSQTPATAEKKSVLGPAIEFKTTEHDFGTFEQGGNGTFEFVFTNTGSEPLVLSNVKSSCGCTIPEWPKDPIKAGESAVIKVSYDTQRIGNFNKSISVYSNAQEAPVMLQIKGVITAKPAAPEQTTPSTAPAQK